MDKCENRQNAKQRRAPASSHVQGAGVHNSRTKMRTAVILGMLSVLSLEATAFSTPSLLSLPNRAATRSGATTLQCRSEEPNNKQTRSAFLRLATATAFAATQSAGVLPAWAQAAGGLDCKAQVGGGTKCKLRTRQLFPFGPCGFGRDYRCCVGVGFRTLLMDA